MESDKQNKRIYENADVLLLDDIDYLIGEKNKRNFIDLFNTLYEKNKQIIIVSKKDPASLKVLKKIWYQPIWRTSIELFPPDYDLRCKIIEKKIKNTIIENKIEEESLIFIANVCRNNIRVLEEAISRLIAYAKEKRPNKLDLSFTKMALRDFIK